MSFIKKLFNLNTSIEFNTLQNSHKYDGSKKTIVFICGSIPTFDKDSGSNRLKEIIKAYIELNFNCIIIVNQLENATKYFDYFNGLGVLIYNDHKTKNKTISFLKSIPKIDFIWYYGPNSLKKNYAIVSKIQPHSKSIYDMVDIHFLRYKRAIDLNPKKISLKKRYNKYFKIETVLAKRVDVVIAISEQEKSIMSSYLDKNKIITISNIHYPKINWQDTLPFEKRKNILFIGSSHTPNIDALYYLHEKIMPIVWKELPHLKVDVIGNLNNEITDINHINIIFHGYVPEIEPFFNTAKFMIAPLRYGAGVKGKIGQSFEYYLPLITTEIGAEGMFLKHNENALIANNDEDFANKIINLYNNENLWQHLQNHSEESLKPFSREILRKKILSI